MHLRIARQTVILDLRTLMIVMIATSLLLAVSLMVAVGPRFRDGLGDWTAALLLQAAVFGLYSARNAWPDFATIVLPNALFITCMTLQAAAILGFYGKQLDQRWHVLPALLVAILFAVTIDKYALRVVLAGGLFGSGMLALAILVQWRSREDRSSARWLLLTGFMIGAVTMYSRAAVGLLLPSAIPGFMVASPFQGITYILGFATILVTSVGFLLLHKERSEEAAQKLALTDPLTGAFNRRTFLEFADKEIARTRREKGALSLVMLDLDLFKEINDRYGHLAGDEVLKGVVKTVLTCLRKEDLLVRYGGEEFCILLPSVASDRATAMAERTREVVEKAKFAHNGRSLQVTVSIGVAGLSNRSNEGVETLVSRADEALYAAKKAGRNRVVTLKHDSWDADGEPAEAAELTS